LGSWFWAPISTRQKAGFAFQGNPAFRVNWALSRTMLIKWRIIRREISPPPDENIHIVALNK
jgi:hypothetical protein